MTVAPIPEGYPRISPYLAVAGAEDAIAFYTDVFGAVERGRMPGPGGMVLHAELGFGDSVVMLSDANAEWGNLGPADIGGTPVTICLYVEDVDAVVALAKDRGAELVRPVTDQFYGDRSGLIEDPWGHRWLVQSHVEDVDFDEMNRRMAAMSEGPDGAA